MKKLIWIIILILLAGIAIWWLNTGEKKPGEKSVQSYSSEIFSISFKYPGHYFIHESQNQEEGRHSIVLFEDTPFNRGLASGEVLGTDSPPTITVSIFDNSTNNYTEKNFIEESLFSNFGLSNKAVSEVRVENETGLLYWADGLWQSLNVVVAKPDFVYMFTGFYNSEEDEIVDVFQGVLNTVEFVPKEV